MQKQVIIAIGREYGSAGHEIASVIARDLELPLYDRSLLESVAQEQKVDISVIEQFDEKHRNPFLSRTVKGFSNSVEQMVAEMQFDFIRKKAAEGESFVIVGRCADYVLAGNPALVSIFVRGEKQEKLHRIMEKYSLDEKEALAVMKKKDLKRKTYHNHYSRIPWGDSRGYDLCLNSSPLGVEKAAELIEDYVQCRFGERA